LAALAARQHGVVTRAQLAGLGLGRGAIAHRLRVGRLYLIHRGVYAVGHSALTQEGTWMAAVLACGPRAVLSHRSAAGLWELLQPESRQVEVTVPRGSTRPGICAYQDELAAEEVVERRGIPVTSVLRTCLDLAARVSRAELSRALREAEVRRLITLAELARILDARPGRRGNALVRAVLADAGYGIGRTRSELEAAFTRFLRGHHLPPPKRNRHMRVGAIEIEADCVWPEEQLIVELDGRAFHETATAFERDRARDRALAAHGWTTVRVTWRQLHRDELQLARDLRTLMRRNLD
jgi:very-short-patch-repair endonuclease